MIMKYQKILIIVLIVICEKCNGNIIRNESIKSASFTFDFYRVIFNENENTVVSPLSLRTLLSILYISVTGNSEIELHEKAHLGDKLQEYISQRQLFLKHISSQNFKTANKIFIKKEGSLKPNFLEIIEGLGCHIEQVDFSQRVATANKMNAWVEIQTNGMIKNLISPYAINDYSALFLVNSLHFKAQWKFPFAEDGVFQTNFTDSSGSIHLIDFMFDTNEYKVANLDNIHVSVLEIPYSDDSNFVFWVMLPDENSNIIELKNFLSYNFINETILKLTNGYYDIILPSFEIESSIDGVDSLRKLGINSIFDSNEVFMFEDGLSVSDIQQNCKIRVNTNGTEVAVGTYLGISYTISIPTFHVRRPFIYMILSADTHEPFFIGHFSKPN